MVLYEIMSVSPRFKKVVLSDTVFDKLLLYGNLTWKAVDRICSHDTSDALLFLLEGSKLFGHVRIQLLFPGSLNTWIFHIF